MLLVLIVGRIRGLNSCPNNGKWAVVQWRPQVTRMAARYGPQGGQFAGCTCRVALARTSQRGSPPAGLSPRLQERSTWEWQGDFCMGQLLSAALRTSLNGSACLTRLWRRKQPISWCLQGRTPHYEARCDRSNLSTKQ